MAGFDPSQPRDEEGKWTDAEMSARKAAGLSGTDVNLDLALRVAKTFGKRKGFTKQEFISNYNNTSLAMGIPNPDGEAAFLEFAKKYSAKHKGFEGMMLWWAGTRKDGEPVFVFIESSEKK